MSGLTNLWQRLTRILSGTIAESIAQLLARIALAGIFWRSYQTKVVDGTWLQIDEVQYLIFENEFSGLPIPTDLAVPMATYAEFAFPILLALGLFTRFSALALMGMAVVIQLFVFPDAAHFFGWAITVLALGAFLVSRGGGLFSLDAIIGRFTAAKDA
ncbi:DoxX family protein [Erythrobacter crassostreae]|uniref:DoxX family protein n=1 Tax=Erythrobacter crassostreae TaxID=2828328 RepID=A0A9X1F0M6_9SPHN|nr:DoxX family protein [Erythrobacter crassostrea]MBV7258165.1 DoxX family protein [Erythrobacter crassostrea]